MSTKVVFIGGGSAKFVREVVVDLFNYVELQDITVCLMDINRERVKLAEALVKKIIREMKIEASVESTLDLRKALDGSDYVIISYMIGGYECYRRDVEIPEKYGVLQTISDTTGPGAVMRLVRTAPEIRKIVRNLKELSPDAWVLNYANPMAMNTWYFGEYGHSRTIGLCHSIQGCYAEFFAKWLNVPPEEIEYSAGGINHVNFYLTLKHNGRDLYPDLRTCAEKVIKEYPAERLRFELLEYLGYFPAEGPQHQAEYYPWFMKDPETAVHYGAETGSGYRVDLKYFQEKNVEVKKQISGELPIDFNESIEYGGKIIHSLETGRIREIYGNVRNKGLISNLPDNAVVEVPCMVSKNKILPCRIAPLPLQLAAVMRPHIAVQEMAVAAVVRKDRKLLEQAIQTDPLTGAILTLPRIKEMSNELFKANSAYLEDWK